MIKNKKPIYIGLDIGGTKIDLQLFDGKLNPILSRQVKTETAHGQKGFLNQLYALIDEVFIKGIKGIGIALPGIVDQKKGLLVRAPHLPTAKNLRLRDLVKKRYKVPVRVDHDINGFLIDEYQNPRLRKYQTVLAVMLGTGLGGAAMFSGKLFYGAKGFAGEFGHMVISQSGRLKTWEENTSGHYLAKYPALRKKLVENFGLGLANLNLIFNPDAILLGGSVYVHHLKNKHKELKAMIAKHALDQSAPELISAGYETSVARGMVRLLKSGISLRGSEEPSGSRTRNQK